MLGGSQDVATPSPANDLNIQILAELKSLRGQMTVMEQQVAERTEDDSIRMYQTAAAPTTASATATQLDQVVVPFMPILQSSE